MWRSKRVRNPAGAIKMIRIVRHISVRFWLATLAVLPSGFILFPRLSGWLADMPASVFIVLMYLVCGLGIGLFMDISGLWRIKRLVNEAQLWERSGIATRAEKKLIRAVRIYDSAWISPLAARRTGPMLTASLARFYLASGSRRREIQGAAGAWLAQNPKDESLARFWLERIRDQDLSRGFTQSILTALADSWYADHGLCRPLAAVFLEQGRMDFSARRLYRSFLDMVDAADGNDALSEQDSALAQMIREMMSARLDTPDPEPEPEPEITAPDSGTLGDERLDLEGQEDDGRISAFAAGTGGEPVDDGSFTADRTGKAGHAVFSLVQAREKWWGRVRGILAACLGVWLAFFAWGTFSHMFKTAEQPAQQIKVVIPKPFTIQVAAYHKKAHAENYMAVLAKNGVKTIMKITDGGGKTWYLVRASEFMDRESAQVYGNRLKADHIIDEFFVTKK